MSTINTLSSENIVYCVDLNIASVPGRGTEGQVFRCSTQKGAHRSAVKRCDVPRKHADEELR